MTNPIPDDVVAQLESLGIKRETYALSPTPRLQKFIAARLTEAARDIPTFPLTIDITLDALMTLRSKYNEGRETKVSVNDFVIKASALSLGAVPTVRSSFTPVGIVTHDNADISVAVATDIGLMTPIVRAAENKSVDQIGAEVKDLSTRAKAGKLQPDEYVGGAFTVSNLGMFGITSFGSIINPPQSAILSVGAAGQRIVARDGAPAVATMMTVTMTCDHRIVDGAIGAKWLADFRERLESPEQLIG